MTLARFFLKLRTNSGLSLRDVGKRAKPSLDASTILKIDAGRPVRAKTLGQALRAIGLTEMDDSYIEAFALWSTEQAATLPFAAVDRSIARSRAGNQKAFDATLQRVAAALNKMPETDWPIMEEALNHPSALKLWMQSRK